MSAPKRPKPNPLPLPRPKDGTREIHHKVDRSQYSPQIPKPKKTVLAASKYKLGKLAPKYDRRTPYLSEFLVRHKLPPGKSFDYLSGFTQPLGMLGNDVAGNCTCAAIFHMLQVQAAVAGKPVPSVDELTTQAMRLYKAITLEVNGRAYDPDDPSTDTGLALLDVMKFCVRNGIIGAFVKLHHNDREEIEFGGGAFGGLYTGAMLPLSAQAQISAKKPWTVVSGPDAEAGTWGGHAMFLGKADAKSVSYVTWGGDQEADDPWVNKYADEMYAVIDNVWVDGDRPAPSGFDIQKLREYLASL